MTLRTRALLRALAAASALLLGAMAAPAAPAAAHPFGPPATANLSIDGSKVRIDWRAAEDDWVVLGQSLGAFEDPVVGTVATDITGEQKIARSTAVRDYLTGRIKVSQRGQQCRVTLLPLEQLLKDGARLRFDCPASVEEIEVTINALTDLNPAYRTMLTAPSSVAPAKALFTSTETQQSLRNTGDGADPNVGVAAVGVGTALAAAGALAVFTFRRRRSERTT